MTVRADFSVGMSECPATVMMNCSYAVAAEPAGESVSVEAEGCACDITGAGLTQRSDPAERLSRMRVSRHNKAST